jgi:hypothetical protein
MCVNALGYGVALFKTRFLNTYLFYVQLVAISSNAILPDLPIRNKSIVTFLP